MKIAAILSLAALAVAKPIVKRDGSAGVEGPTPFIGKGQVHMYHDTDGEHMGCATETGLWTVDYSQCGTFTGEKTDDLYVHISTSAGPCNTFGYFECTTSEAPTDYQAYDWGGGLGSRIFFGDLYMTYFHGPFQYPEGDEAITIGIYDGSNSGKWVQLGWNTTTTS